MAKILRESLKEMLFLLPENYESAEFFPSPEELQYKIIVKGIGNPKNLYDKNNEEEVRECEEVEKEDDEMENINYETEESDDVGDELSYTEHQLKHTVKLAPEFQFDVYRQFNLHSPDFCNFKNFHDYMQSQRQQPSKVISGEGNDSHEGKVGEEGQWMNEETWSKKQNTSREPKKEKPQQVQNFITTSKQRQQAKKKHTQPVQKTHVSLEKCISMFSSKLSFDNKRLVWQISSLSENQLNALVKRKEELLIKYHQKHFTRIYPKGTRFDSSNYDPVQAFNVGSQVIALNFQTNDENLQLYLSKFTANKGSGYILKPSHMLGKIKNYSDTLKKRVVINFISGQQLKPEKETSDKDVVDPYIEAYVRGLP